MIKFKHFAIFTLVFILISSTLAFSQENITITTYYPSPLGVYRVLRLNPGPNPGLCNNSCEMYYDSTQNRLYLCIPSETPPWQRIGLFSEIPDQWWAESSGNIYKTNTGNVGIGINNPDRLLTVFSAANTIALHVITGNANFEEKVSIGTSSPTYTYDLEVDGTIQADNYYSGDGTQGLDGVTVINILTNDVSGDGIPDPCTITVRDGLVTSTTCPTS